MQDTILIYVVGFAAPLLGIVLGIDLRPKKEGGDKPGFDSFFIMLMILGGILWSPFAHGLEWVNTPYPFWTWALSTFLFFIGLMLGANMSEEQTTEESEKPEAKATDPA